LLDDEDPEVKEHVHGKLISMGAEVIPSLEEAWEQQVEGSIQSSIEEIIFLIQSERVISDLRSWQARTHPSLLEGWLHVTRYRYPDLNEKELRMAFNRLTNRIWLELRAGMALPEKLTQINRMLYEREKFSGDRKNPFRPRLHYLNELMETKKGSPLSLGMLYLVICEQLELPMEGIVVPGYFVLVHRDGGNTFYLDPFNKGKLFLRKDLARYLKQIKAQKAPEDFKPATAPEVIHTLIRALIQGYRKADKGNKVRELQQLLEAIREA
ncbi:MAG: hypothetical protein D6722_24540, partial [Bacteroidetes bacterium]